MDDLRDYRFYENDLVHPNKLAISYILEKFDAHYLDDKTKNQVKLIFTLLKGKYYQNPILTYSEVIKRNLTPNKFQLILQKEEHLIWMAITQFLAK